MSGHLDKCRENPCLGSFALFKNFAFEVNTINFNLKTIFQVNKKTKQLKNEAYIKVTFTISKILYNGNSSRKSLNL